MFVKFYTSQKKFVKCFSESPTKLIGVLEPLEFALVMWMAGQPVEAEKEINTRTVDILSSEPDGDPLEDSQKEDNPEPPARGPHVFGIGSEAQCISHF